MTQTASDVSDLCERQPYFHRVRLRSMPDALYLYSSQGWSA